MKKHAIFGPPGTGKTTRLTEEIAQRIRPNVRSAVLSFTRAAAGVLASRVNKRHITFLGTVHSLAFHTLGLERSQVATAESFMQFCYGNKEEIEYSLSIRTYADRNNTDLFEAYALMSYGPQSVPFNVVEYYINAYEGWKKANYLCDFDDMLHRAIGKVDPLFDVVIVDEAQDLSRLQWDFILSIVAPSGELLMAGDDDQSIFAWSGAWAKGMAEITDTYDVLSQSYRVPPEIQKIAEGTVGQIMERVPKKYLPRAGQGEINYFGDYNPMLAMHTDHTVLVRSQWGLKKIERQLIEMAVPYSGGQNYFNSARARLLRAIHAEDLATIKRLVRYLTPQARVKLENDRLPVFGPEAVDYTYCQQDEYDYLHQVDLFSEGKVQLSTIHSFKGEEDEHIVLICDCSYIVESAADTQLRFEDEVRVWYVGLTRARRRLDLIGYNQFILS